MLALVDSPARCLFPKRRRISPGRVAWLESDIRASESRTAW
ncbi:AlpA family phage regulatory protein [Mesorhizobium sp.]